MATQITHPNEFARRLALGEINLETDVFKLIFNSTAPLVTADARYGAGGTVNLVTGELTGGDLLVGGKTVDLTVGAVTDPVPITALNVVIAVNAGNPSVQYGYIYDDTHVNKISIAFFDFGSLQDLSLSTSTLDFVTSGFTDINPNG